MGKEGSTGLAFGLVIASGFCTLFGALGILFAKGEMDTRFLTISMALSAGVMTYVSFVEILSVKSVDYFQDSGLGEVSS